MSARSVSNNPDLSEPVGIVSGPLVRIGALAGVWFGAVAFIARTLPSTVSVVVVVAGAAAGATLLYCMLVDRPASSTAAFLAGRLEQSDLKTTELQERLAGVQAEHERDRRKVERLGGILAATQHELNREITLLGFAVDDVVDEADEPLPPHVEGLKVALEHVEEGQRNVSALSRLGTGDSTDRIGAFTASDVAPLTQQTSISIERNDQIWGDRDLWRLFVKNAVRNAEAHGHASEVTLSTGDGRLTIADNGHGCTTEDLERAWKAGLRPNGTRSAGTQIMRRVADAHDAEVTLQGEPGAGVRIVADVRDLEIDLRQRGAIESPIGTPHKAGGGRLTPSA